MKLSLGLCFVLVLCAASRAQLPPDLKSDLGPGVPAFRVRPGYRVTRVLPDKQHGVRDARFLEFSGDDKALFVSQRHEGDILCLRDPDETGMYKTVTTFVKDKRSVQGMCWHDGWLYFGQSAEGSVSRARDKDGDGVADEVETILPRNSTPSGGGHPFEGVLVTDKEIYITSSDPTNMTEELESPRK